MAASGVVWKRVRDRSGAPDTPSKKSQMCATGSPPFAVGCPCGRAQVARAANDIQLAARGTRFSVRTTCHAPQLGPAGEEISLPFVALSPLLAGLRGRHL